MEYKTIEKKHSLLEMDGISERTTEEHWKLYEGYVKKSNEIFEKLKTADQGTANQTFSELRELKLELSFALGGVKNHELYFGHLGGKGGDPNGNLGSLIEKHFGTIENWKKDMKQTGIAARGWVWLAYDWDSRDLHNYLGDSQNTYPIWNATPLVALDTYEHAYFIDYGTDRAKYIDAFFKNLDWAVIEKRFSNFQIPA